MRLVVVLLTLWTASAATSTSDCDVVIIGGSVAGIAAALAVATENVTACLLEPTDWLGGQMTSGGVPALDFAPEGYPTPFGFTTDTQEPNITPNFLHLLRQLARPNYHTCWVSPYCFLPTELLAKALGPMAAAVSRRLRIFYETVPIHATVGVDGRVTGLNAVKRTPHPTIQCGGYDLPPSAQIEDWYTPESSARFAKQTLQFESAVWVDTSYNGELLALSGGSFLQAADEEYDGDVRGTGGNDTIGQAAIMTLQIALDAEPVSPPEPPSMLKPWPEWGQNPFRYAEALYWGSFNLTFAEFWTRRRSFAASAHANMSSASRGLFNFHPPPLNTVSPGDISLMVWHDYVYGYVFKSKQQARHDVEEDMWRGGYNIETLRGAETFAHLAYDYFKRKAPEDIRLRMRKDSSHLGTCTGLAKMPYIRDGRRSIGIGDYTMNVSAKALIPGTPTALPWRDRVFIAQHGFDMWGHRQMPVSDSYPKYISNISAACNTGGEKGPSCTPDEKFGCPCIPAFVPFRALTNRAVPNLVVGGLPMANSFMVSSAFRMHPVEWTSGTAAGVVAAFMAQRQLQSTEEVLGEIVELQAKLRVHTPLEWTIGGREWPPNDRSEIGI